MPYNINPKRQQVTDINDYDKARILDAYDDHNRNKKY